MNSKILRVPLIRHFAMIAALFAVFLQSSPVLCAQEIHRNLILSRSTTFKAMTYRISAEKNLTKPIITVQGHDIIIDFKNSILQGAGPTMNPDQFEGVAILIQNSKKVTIRNAKVRGYKVALIARNVEELVLDNCDFSYNYRPHLNSTQEKEDISDWMSYHQNEKDQWLRYGAGMYLRACKKALIKNCKVTGSQNALMMMECDSALIVDNDFSFNSGIGIGMYRCNGNSVLYNRIIFNVRGYSDGIYNRGQDSAGILVYEQSNRNLFYKNNVTHSGDGLFLWAGQTTMDNGQGGCNDNRVLSNDFSYAPTNGVEITFSRNSILDNRIFECDNGIWGGYSYETIISKNKFRNNNTAIAIEHGQRNKISYNIFYGDKQAIHLWGRASQPDDWGYAKFRDTRSHNYQIAFNNFHGNQTVFNLNRTDSLNLFNNIYQDFGTLYKTDSTVSNLDSSVSEELSSELSGDHPFDLPVIDKPSNPFKNSGAFAGRKNILITEWGPYDFRRPIIWNTNPSDSGTLLRFELKGPPGKWKVRSFRGIDSLSVRSGSFPAALTARRSVTAATDIEIELEYSGEAIITAFGNTVPKGKPSTFFFRKFFQPVNWTVNWFRLDTSSYNPLKTGQLFPAVGGPEALQTEHPDRLDYAWWNGIKTDTTVYTRFITTAAGTAFFEKGEYELSVTWDDAVRVYLDNKLILNEWTPTKYDFDEAPNRRIPLKLSGNQSFRVEHLNLGGFSVLSFKLNRNY